MDKECWQKWCPFNEFPKKIWLDKLILNEMGLTICFESDDARIINFIFGNYALSCRITNEGDLIQTINYWSNEYGVDFFDWPLYRSNNSSFIKWFNKESCEKFAHKNIEHYVFITEDEIVDVISAIPPQIIIE